MEVCVSRGSQVSVPRGSSSQTRPCLLWPLTFSCGRISPLFPLTASSRWHAVSVTGLNGEARGSVRLFNERGQLFCGQMRRLPCLYFCSIYHFVFKRVSFTASRLSRQGARWEEGKDTALTKPRQMTWEITKQLQPLPPTMNWNAAESNSRPSVISRYPGGHNWQFATAVQVGAGGLTHTSQKSKLPQPLKFLVRSELRQNRNQVTASSLRLKPPHLVFGVRFKVN